ncbi:membrane protein [Adhaeribacter aerolatus]|uniref:Membrane protein n=1 Tax=Adhaeribacter aerolatus TaxID=670289 RepID=A0A512AX52_9BACT|nr:DoxX family membrane protein [Adhaeribacter aerolatus]GEO04260.1 membrane protein [Adhaeribacter aerolatus]
MAPLIVLLAVFAATWSLGRALKLRKLNLNQSGRVAMCAMLLFAGTSHFYLTKGMVLTMPDFLPAKEALVYFTGVSEIIFGIGLLFESTRRLTSVLLFLFFLAVLPANIVAAFKHVDIPSATYTGPGLNYLWFRIPLQLLFIPWTYYFGYRQQSFTVDTIKPAIKSPKLA